VDSQHPCPEVASLYAAIFELGIDRQISRQIDKMICKGTVAIA